VPDFIPGIELNRRFYEEAVAPLLGRVPHAAARVGWGSDVLGFDTARSTDHGWGPQLLIVVDAAVADGVRAALDDRLPDHFAGWPVRYGWDDTPVIHHVVVSDLATWSVRQLGIDATGDLTTADWIAVPQQKLLEATAGAVYHETPAD
jgi:hypothetical protein